MSLLKQLTETAAAGSVSANAIAGTAGGLSREEDSGEKKKKKKETMKRKTLLYHMVGEGDDAAFDTADVISKMKQAERSAQVEQDAVPFALEDEDGNIVKVYVRADQADDFEEALQSALAGNDEDEDDENTSTEIAEVLYKLRDKFDIIDIDYPAIPEDEEVDQEVEGDEGDQLGNAGEGEGEGGDELGLTGAGEGEGEGGEETGEEGMVAGGEESEAASALTQVIDMMKADAEARKAEAEAKKADADARIANAEADAAAEKVKQEEEVLDMEAYYKKKDDEKKESGRLAKLAKYKHDLATDEESSVEDEEEVQEIVTPQDLADLLVKRLQAQN